MYSITWQPSVGRKEINKSKKNLHVTKKIENTAKKQQLQKSFPVEKKQNTTNFKTHQEDWDPRKAGALQTWIITSLSGA